MNGVQAHLLVNHLPVLGLAISALFGSVVLYSKRPGLRSTYHLIALGSYVAAVLAFITGELALHTLADSQDPALADTYVEVHDTIAHDFVGLFWLGLALHAIVSVLLWRKRKLPKALDVVTVAFAILCFLITIVIAHSGGEIRHPHIR